MFGIKLRIRYHHRPIPRGALALVLLPVVLLAASTLSRAQATAPSSPASASATFGVRQFYLTKTLYNGAQAKTACAKGYHMASIWELADPSALEYNTARGMISPDSGAGPPTASKLFTSIIIERGWVRTGYASSITGIAGQANCSSWWSDYYGDWGTVVNLSSNWTGSAQDVDVWNAEVRTCDTNVRVWCVQDDSVWHVYLSLVLKE